MGAYDTAAECQREREGLVLTVPKDLKDDPKDYAAALSRVTKDAECIATDDPRLAK